MLRNYMTSVENQSIEINFVVLRGCRTTRTMRNSAASLKFPDQVSSCHAQNRKLCCSSRAKETKVYAATYFTFIRSRARLNHSWPCVNVRPHSPGFFLCTFQFCRKVSARLQPTFPRTSRQALFIGRRSSLIIVNPRISPARENILPRCLFSADNVLSKTNGLDNY